MLLSWAFKKSYIPLQIQASDSDKKLAQCEHTIWVIQGVLFLLCCMFTIHEAGHAASLVFVLGMKLHSVLQYRMNYGFNKWVLRVQLYCTPVRCLH